jgi:hypothetical protein
MLALWVVKELHCHRNFLFWQSWSLAKLKKQTDLEHKQITKMA